MKRFPRKPNVLVVDDKPHNVVVLEAVLDNDYNVISAHSAGEAIAFLTQRPESVDLILMDVEMPTMDGFEATRRIKQLAGCEDIPVIFISGVFTEDLHIKKGYEAGGVDYFTKPFNTPVLRMKLAVYASYKLHDEVLKAREKAVKESEELLRTGRKLAMLLEDLRIGVLITDVEGQICKSTEDVDRIIGSVAPVQDNSYHEILGWWDASGRMKDHNGPLTRALHYGESSHSEPLSIPSADGGFKTILVAASPLRGLDAKIAGAVVLVQDLTESKRIEEELEQRVAKLMVA